MKNHVEYVGIIIQGGSVKPRTATDRRGRRLSAQQKDLLYVSPFSKHIQEGAISLTDEILEKVDEIYNNL